MSYKIYAKALYLLTQAHAPTLELNDHHKENMIGKIDKFGFLWYQLHRPEGLRWERAICPRSKTSCCDTCALFGGLTVDSESTTCSLKLCDKTVEFTSFEDERNGSVVNNVEA